MGGNSPLNKSDYFPRRHIGPGDSETSEMLSFLGYDSLKTLMDAVVPDNIRMDGELALPAPQSERETLQLAADLASRNKVVRSYMGMGYADCIVPPVIQRNIMENPGWYTAYTPYQPEIAQGRLEMLLNFQTVVSDLTGLEIANSSLLDEGTAAAEALTLSQAITRRGAGSRFFVDQNCHPQTIAIVQTRAEAKGVPVEVGAPEDFVFDDTTLGVLLQYPGTDGVVRDFSEVSKKARDAGALVTVATDLLSLVLLTPPGEWSADIVIGNSQRFGVPMGYGGPHAAFFATREKYKRNIPGRIIGISRDAHGRDALRMALQTREQHIRRDKATSNICTAQVLLAVMAGAYAVYHGPEGLQRIARRVHQLAGQLATGLTKLGFDVADSAFFDTLLVRMTKEDADAVIGEAVSRGLELRRLSDGEITVALDETTTDADVHDLLSSFARGETVPFTIDDLSAGTNLAGFERTSGFMEHPCFHNYRSETEMLRYLKRLEDRDLSLTSAMIPLGSCTMKLNATAEMIPVSWPEFGGLHPFTALENARGYDELFQRLEHQLAVISGFHSVSLQPNAGSQGEFTGLLVINAFHKKNGQEERDVCLIPRSAHGTNPASAVMAGMRVVVVATDDEGNIDVDDLRARAEEHSAKLAALMVTYPSTHGVFESSIREVCSIIHEHGGQVYLDGANMNALVGLCRPGEIGADVCHINLHKTFSIPHGGGGPGMGPIGVAEHLAPFLPGHPVIPTGGQDGCGTVSAAPWGSSSILPISWTYINMMGGTGLLKATQVAILNANYVAKRLEGHYELLYAGQGGLIGHECIIDTRPFKASAGVDVEDMAKRLIDYGFHPPTISFPVAGTMMVEPTESESKAELDRFCDAMISIRDEIRTIEAGNMDKDDNPLKNAPHTLFEIADANWEHPYSRETAVFPSPETRAHKIWPPVSRIEGAWGDRNLVCVCPPIEEYEMAEG